MATSMEEKVKKLDDQDREYLNRFYRDIFKSCLNEDGSFSLYELYARINDYRKDLDRLDQNISRTDAAGLRSKFNSYFGEWFPHAFYQRNRELLGDVCKAIRNDIYETMDYQNAIVFMNDPGNAEQDKTDTELYLAENAEKFFNRIRSYREMANINVNGPAKAYFSQENPNKFSDLRHDEIASVTVEQGIIPTEEQIFSAKEPVKPDPLGNPPPKPGPWSRFLNIFNIKTKEYKAYEQKQAEYAIRKAEHEVQMARYETQMETYNQKKSYKNAFEKKTQLNNEAKEKLTQQLKKEEDETKKLEEEQTKLQKELEKANEKLEKQEEELKKQKEELKQQQEKEKVQEKKRTEEKNISEQNQKKREENRKFADEEMKENSANNLTYDEKHELFGWYHNANRVEGKKYDEKPFMDKNGEIGKRKVPADRKTAIADMGEQAFLYIAGMLKKSESRSQKIPSQIVNAVGIYQMFYNKEGKLQQDKYAEMQKVGTDLGKFIDTVTADKWAVEDSKLTLGQFADKIANNESIFLPTTQEKVLETYQKKFKSASKDVNKAPAGPKPKEMEKPQNGMKVGP